MTEYIKISKISNGSDFQYIDSIELAFDITLSGQYQIDQWVLNLEGMSGRLYRNFINYLLSHLSTVNYLEIGVWQGSTLCSALWNNSISAIAIEDWSQFDGPRDQFFANLSAVTGKNTVKILEQDFRSVDWQKLPKSNVYMFDGPHSVQDHFDALDLVKDALTDEFVFIVDDWNASHVKQGTLKALQDGNYEYSAICIETTPDGSHPHICRQNSNWHNGYFLASVKKPRKNSV